VAVADGKQRARDLDREVERSARGEVFHVDVAAHVPRRDGVVSAVRAGRDAEVPRKRPDGNRDRGRVVVDEPRDSAVARRSGRLTVEVPAADVRARDRIGEESTPVLARGDDRDTPPLVLEREEVDAERVARLRALDGDRTGERVARGLDRRQIGGSGVGRQLPVERVSAVERDDGAGFDGERRVEGVVPRVMDVLRRVGESVVRGRGVVDGEPAAGHTEACTRREHNGRRRGRRERDSDSETEHERGDQRDPVAVVEFSSEAVEQFGELPVHEHPGERARSLALGVPFPAPWRLAGIVGPASVGLLGLRVRNVSGGRKLGSTLPGRHVRQERDGDKLERTHHQDDPPDTRLRGVEGVHADEKEVDGNEVLDQEDRTERDQPEHHRRPELPVVPDPNHHQHREQCGVDCREDGACRRCWTHRHRQPTSSVIDSNVSQWFSNRSVRKYSVP